MEKHIDIKGFEGLYTISDMGIVISLPKSWGNGKHNGIIMRPSGKRYLMYSLSKDGKKYYKKAHRLVAEHFLSNAQNKPCINHKDGDSKNNNVTNLEWCTYRENIKHAYSTGLIKTNKDAIRNHKPVLDLYSGIFYSSIKEAATCKNIKPWDLKSDLNKTLNRFGLVLV